MRLPYFCILLIFFSLQFCTLLNAATFDYMNSTSPSPRWEKYRNGTARLAILKCCGGAVTRSYNFYQYGIFTASIRLHRGFSAGVVSTFYLRSHGAYWDEVDFEFLGNTESRNYILHTNYFAQGKGNNEEQYQFWFDPGAAYHDYTIWWTKEFVAWMVDDVVIRVLQRNQWAPYSAPGFVKQPMLVYGSIWDGSAWASNGGAIKSDYTKGPFYIYYGGMDFSKTNCVRSFTGNKPCISKTGTNANWNQKLSQAQMKQMTLYRKKYLVFSYQFPR